MSHFAGLVILTPDYLKKHFMEDALAPYDENMEVPEHSNGEVKDYDKANFIAFYKLNDFDNVVCDELVKSGKLKPFEEQDTYTTKSAYAYNSYPDYTDEYVRIFKEKHPKLWSDFDKIYEEHGDDWNSNAWRFNYVSGKWEEWSRYNKNSKWDWYEVGGRWNDCIKTKSGEFVDECLLDEIDWTDFTDDDYCKKPQKDIFGTSKRVLKKNVRWHFTENDLPFCLVINGIWVEKGSMGWWAITSNEMSHEDWVSKVKEILDRLPQDSEVSIVDFHI